MFQSFCSTLRLITYGDLVPNSMTVRNFVKNVVELGANGIGALVANIIHFSFQAGQNLIL